MQEESFMDRLNRPVVIDICHPCQAFWFDTRESVSLTPGSTLALFKIIGDKTGKPGPAGTDTPRCPRCREKLKETNDLQKTTRFRYLACPKGEGRFISFFDFLREKEFVKPMTARQIAELREQVQTVNCSNCGAPVDVEQGAACKHCGSPLSMFDMKHAEKLVGQLQKAEAVAQTVHPLFEKEFAAMRKEGTSPTRFANDRVWKEDVSVSGLVGAGLHAVARWISER
jgi:hypothetical protein